MLLGPGLGTLIEDDRGPVGPAEGKLQTKPINLPPNVKYGSEIAGAANMIQHMNNGDLDGMINDVKAYGLDKGMEKLTSSGCWALWAIDVGVLAGESALTERHERVYGVYQRLRQQGYKYEEIKKAHGGGYFTLDKRLWDARKQFPVDTETEITTSYKGNAENMFIAFEVRYRIEDYSSKHSEEAQKTMLQNAGEELEYWGCWTVDFIHWMWHHGKPPQKPTQSVPVKPPPYKPRPPKKPPTNPGGDHPDDNYDVSTIEITRDKSLFNAYLRLAQTGNNTDLFYDLSAIAAQDTATSRAMKDYWRSDVWLLASELDELFIETFPGFVDGLPDKALDDLDDFGFTVSMKGFGLKPSKKIPDKVVRPFSLKMVKELYEDNPSLVGAILESDRQMIENVISTARVAVLHNGYWRAVGNMLAQNSEPVRWVDASFDADDLSGCPLLIIPSGGLYGLEGSPSFESELEAYASAGGTIVVFAQQRGTEYGALPGGLSGYGWLEDQSCHYSSVGITTYEPFLAGMGGSTLGLNVDGYFTGWPEGATVVLSRTKNAQPAMLMYGIGKGRVMACSAYEDWAFDHSAASSDGKTLLRDLVAWALGPADIPAVAPSSGKVSIPVNVTNTGDSAATSAIIQTVDPGRNPSTSIRQTVNIAPGASARVDVAIDAPASTGIWWVDCVLQNASGASVSQRFDAQRFAVSRYSQNPGGFLYDFSGVLFDITSETEYMFRGSSVNFTVHLYNYDETDRSLTIKYDWTHAIFDEKHVTVPAGGRLNLTYTRAKADSGRFWA